MDKSDAAHFDEHDHPVEREESEKSAKTGKKKKKRRKEKSKRKEESKKKRKEPEDNGQDSDIGKLKCKKTIENTDTGATAADGTSARQFSVETLRLIVSRDGTFQQES